MDLKQKILQILEKNRGKAVSGEEIANILSVSRSAVWKGVSALRKDGYDIVAVTNKGYCLNENSEELSPQGIYALYENCPYEIEVIKQVSSTNSVVKSYAQQGKSENYVLFSQSQTEGRGRLGRRFESPDKTGLYMSLLLRPKMSAKDALFITTSAAVAVARAIDSLSENSENSKIKWVNDIYLNDLKVCGILTEASMDFESGGLEYAVLGIGVNVYHSEVFDSELKGIAGGIFKSEVKNARNRLACGILKEFEFCLKEENRTEVLAEYKKRSYLDGKSVNVISPKESYPADVVGIDDEARLIVKTKDGEIKTISSGEVSVRTI